MSVQRSSDALNRRRSLRRLSLYRPFTSRTRIETVCREFVLAAVHENEGSIASCTECQQIIRRLWGLELELEEISAVARRLVRQGKLIDERGCRRLSDDCSNSLAKRVRTSNEVEATAFNEWEHAVSRRFPSLGTLLGQLHDDLAVWIQQIISDYGVEAGILLSPRNNRHAQYLREVEALSNAILPEREAAIMMLRPAALVMFFEETTTMQRRYFENLLATAYLMSVFTLDPAALGGVRHLTNGQRLYLDTNLVYSLLKLNGPERYRATQRVLNLSFHLGYQVCVTPWTVTEMQESVRLARMRLARTRPSPQNLTSLAPDSDDEIFIRAFRQMERETGLSLDDFFALHEQIELLLGAEGVEVVDEGCQAIDALEDRFDEQIAELERVREAPEKPRPLQEHDVKHRLLVQMLRGDKRRRFSDVGYLLLSNDRALCKFADANRDGSKELPFAISLSRWAHITRSLTPRTTDYDKTLADIQETPSVRASGLISQADIVEAQARVNAHEKYPESIAMRMLLDTALGGDDGQGDRGDADGADSGTRANEDETARMLDLEAKLRELMMRAAVEQRERATERDEHAASEAAVKAEHRAERRRRIELEGQVSRLQRQLDDALRARETDGSGADASVLVSTLERELRIVARRLQRENTMVRRLLGSLIAAVGVGVVALPLALGVIIAGWPLVGDICGGIGLLLVAFTVMCGSRKARALATGVGLVLGIVVSVRTLTNEPNAARAPAHAPPGASHSAAGHTIR